MTPILAANSLEIICRSPEQTRRLGMRLGALLQSGDILCLSGGLGAGKTTFVQGLAAGWGSSDRVTSPTFVLVNLYNRSDGARLYHLDAYRLSGPAEAIDLDLEAMLVHGPLAIEWAEHIQEALPPQRLWLHLRDLDENQRDLLLKAEGCRAEGCRPHELLQILRREIYGG